MDTPLYSEDAASELASVLAEAIDRDTNITERCRVAGLSLSAAHRARHGNVPTLENLLRLTVAFGLKFVLEDGQLRAEVLRPEARSELPKSA
jgi:DNA-binding phage protein